MKLSHCLIERCKYKAGMVNGPWRRRNVIDELPKEQQGQALNLMRAAWRVSDAEEGVKRLDHLARFLEHEHESAARSLREGMAEMFTVQRLQLPPSLYKCLGTTNVIESPQSGVQKRTHNVTRWRDPDMVERPLRRWRNMNSAALNLQLTLGHAP